MTSAWQVRQIRPWGQRSFSSRGSWSWMAAASSGDSMFALLNQTQLWRQRAGFKKTERCARSVCPDLRFHEVWSEDISCRPFFHEDERQCLVFWCFVYVCKRLPVSILPSKAAGPSNMRLLICKNSSGSSPPTTVNPKPRLLFSSLVLINVPLSSAGSLVKNGFPPTLTYTPTQTHTHL